MTAAEIAELEEWAATRLMGWEPTAHPPYKALGWWKTNPDGTMDRIKRENWHPSRPDTGQIWMCLAKMVELGWDFRLALMQGAAAYAEFSHYPDWDSAHYARDKEPCVAALLAMRAALEGK